jgi:hypothetical protein
LDKFELHDRQIRASFGTTKYCSYFLKGQECRNKECLYLHKLVPSEETIPKEIVSNNRALFNDQQKIAYQLSGITSVPLSTFKKEMKSFAPKGSSIFPSPETIYNRSYYFAGHKGFKSQSPQINPRKELLEENNDSALALTPKEARLPIEAKIPLLRLYSVDEIKPSNLTQKFTRASESRFSFAKPTEESKATTEVKFDLEETLYKAAKQELVKHNEDIIIDHAWINKLIENDNNSSAENSPHKVKAAFDGNSFELYSLKSGHYCYWDASEGEQVNNT